MFSNTCTNRMYSDSAAGARGAICLLARVQSVKHVENLRWNSVTCQLFSNIFMNFYKACDNVIRTTNIFPNS